RSPRSIPAFPTRRSSDLGICWFLQEALLAKAQAAFGGVVDLERRGAPPRFRAGLRPQGPLPLAEPSQGTRGPQPANRAARRAGGDRKSTRLNSSHGCIPY